jgi:hypothetical protein
MVQYEDYSWKTLLSEIGGLKTSLVSVAMLLSPLYVKWFNSKIYRDFSNSETENMDQFLERAY